MSPVKEGPLMRFISPVTIVKESGATAQNNRYRLERQSVATKEHGATDQMQFGPWREQPEGTDEDSDINVIGLDVTADYIVAVEQRETVLSNSSTYQVTRERRLVVYDKGTLEFVRELLGTEWTDDTEPPPSVYFGYGWFGSSCAGYDGFVYYPYGYSYYDSSTGQTEGRVSVVKYDSENNTIVGEAVINADISQTSGQYIEDCTEVGGALFVLAVQPSDVDSPSTTSGAYIINVIRIDTDTMSVTDTFRLGTFDGDPPQDWASDFDQLRTGSSESGPPRGYIYHDDEQGLFFSVDEMYTSYINSNNNFDTKFVKHYLAKMDRVTFTFENHNIDWTSDDGQIVIEGRYAYDSGVLFTGLGLMEKDTLNVVGTVPGGTEVSIEDRGDTFARQSINRDDEPEETLVMTINVGLPLAADQPET